MVLLTIDFQSPSKLVIASVGLLSCNGVCLKKGEVMRHLILILLFAPLTAFASSKFQKVDVACYGKAKNVEGEMIPVAVSLVTEAISASRHLYIWDNKVGGLTDYKVPVNPALQNGNVGASLIQFQTDDGQVVFEPRPTSCSQAHCYARLETPKFVGLEVLCP